MKKPYLKPQISVIMIEPQAILGLSGKILGSFFSFIVFCIFAL